MGWREAVRQRQRRRYEQGVCRYATCDRPRREGKVYCERCATKRRVQDAGYCARQPRYKRTCGNGRRKSVYLPPEWREEVGRRILALAGRAAARVPLFDHGASHEDRTN